MTVSPAKTQISLGIHPVWSESALCAEWVAKDPRFLHADSEVSDHSGRMSRLISLRWAHMPLCWFCYEAAHIMSFSNFWTITAFFYKTQMHLTWQKTVTVCLFRFNVAFNNFSVISRWCLLATGSSKLTFIVLSHWSTIPQTLDKIPYPVTLSWHWVDQS